MLMQAAGVKTEKDGTITVDAYSKTSADNIYALGDVTNRLNLTPVAIMEGMAFAATAFGDTPTKPIHERVSASAPLCPFEGLVFAAIGFGGFLPKPIHEWVIALGLLFQLSPFGNAHCSHRLWRRSYQTSS